MADAAGDGGETSDGNVGSGDSPAGFVDPMTATPRSEATVDTLAEIASFQVKFSHPAIWTTVPSTTSGLLVSLVTVFYCILTLL